MTLKSVLSSTRMDSLLRVSFLRFSFFLMALLPSAGARPEAGDAGDAGRIVRMGRLRRLACDGLQVTAPEQADGFPAEHELFDLGFHGIVSFADSPLLPRCVGWRKEGTGSADDKLPRHPRRQALDATFDVFLSHNSKDKPTVRRIAEALRDRGLRVWLDEWELIPGRLFQEAIEDIIKSVRAAAVLVEPNGLGPWEDPEMRMCLTQLVRRKLPVIPVQGSTSRTARAASSVRGTTRQAAAS
jgi:TIR domain